MFRLSHIVTNLINASILAGQIHVQNVCFVCEVCVGLSFCACVVKATKTHLHMFWPKISEMFLLQTPEVSFSRLDWSYLVKKSVTLLLTLHTNPQDSSTNSSPSFETGIWCDAELWREECHLGMTAKEMSVFQHTWRYFLLDTAVKTTQI